MIGENYLGRNNKIIAHWKKSFWNASWFAKGLRIYNKTNIKLIKNDIWGCF